jgi:hypothetical protein
MGRFIVKCQSHGSVPEVDLSTIRDRPGVTVLDESNRMMLIESSQEVAEKLSDLLPSWSITPEVITALPDTRLQIREGPSE